MPSVYEYNHVELDNVGKGKRILQPPGGECSDIFGGSPGSTPGSTPGSVTPTRDKSRRGSTDSGVSGSGSGSLNNTQDRLFGGECASPASTPGDVTPRRVIDRMKSTVFSSGNDQVDKANVHTPASPGNLIARRNPITGEMESPRNGRPQKNGFHESLDAVSPGEVTRIRIPPGGKCSGIF